MAENVDRAQLAALGARGSGAPMRSSVARGVDLDAREQEVERCLAANARERWRWRAMLEEHIINGRDDGVLAADVRRLATLHEVRDQLLREWEQIDEERARL